MPRTPRGRARTVRSARSRPVRLLLPPALVVAAAAGVTGWVATQPTSPAAGTRATDRPDHAASAAPSAAEHKHLHVRPSRRAHADGSETVVRIPALGASWSEPVHDGINRKALAHGLGHFPGTEAPGQIGNFALAGHRSGITDPPLRGVDRIAKGNRIAVATPRGKTYTYSVTKIARVSPTDVDVLAQVPGHPHARPTRPMLTLVTCWPATGHSKRVVLQAVLVD